MVSNAEQDGPSENVQTGEGGGAWLPAESGYFGSLQPIAAFLRGRIGTVAAALAVLDSGAMV